MLIAQPAAHLSKSKFQQGLDLQKHLQICATEQLCCELTSTFKNKNEASKSAGAKKRCWSNIELLELIRLILLYHLPNIPQNPFHINPKKEFCK
jgi:hypothetical protein